MDADHLKDTAHTAAAAYWTDAMKGCDPDYEVGLDDVAEVVNAVLEAILPEFERLRAAARIHIT
jgi:hypothetical protein